MGLLKNLKALEAEAKEKGLAVDYETATLREPLMRSMTPHQRDMYVNEMNRKEFFKHYQDSKDNDPASAEQASA